MNQFLFSLVFTRDKKHIHYSHSIVDGGLDEMS